MLSKKKKQRGFTLVELMIVVLIISIGLVGAMDLFSRIFIQTRFISTKLAAAYLAQEGIEIVRNIRDTNWLQNNDWDLGIGSGDQQADYSDQALFAFEDTYLQLDNDFYHYNGSNNNTKFKRNINIQKNEDEISITATVSWDNYEVQVFEKLYNWK